MQTRYFNAFDENFLLVPGSPACVAVGLNLKRIDVNNRTVAPDVWLMAFAGVAVPANGAVPLFAPLLLQAQFVANAIYEMGRPIPGPGLVLVVSSTQDTLTRAVGDDFDITAEVEEWELPAEGTTDVGDLTANVTTKEVWNDAAGPKALVRVQALNNAAGARYLQLFAQDAPLNGQVPIAEWTVGAAAYLDVSFGRDGRMVMSQTAAFVERDGCTLAWSTTPETLTAAAAAGAIKATYK